MRAIFESILIIAALLVLVITAVELQKRYYVPRFEEQCVNGIAYFVGSGGVPASVVVDSSTLRPKRCPILEPEHE